MSGELVQKENSQIEKLEASQDMKKIRADLAKMEAEATALVVDSDEAMEKAGELLNRARTAAKMFKALIKGPKEIQHAAWKATCAYENDLVNAAKVTADIVNPKITARIVEQEKEAQRLRLEAEAKAKKEEEDRKLNEAVALEEAGETEEAQEVIEEETFIPPPPKKEIVRPKGVVITKTWDFEVEDESKLPREYMVPDMKAIRGVVKSMKGKTKIAGVRVFEKTGTQARG